MKFYKAFLLLSRGKQIGLAVCAIHLLAVFSLLGHHLISRRLKPPRPMVVRTIAAAPEKPKQIKQETAAPTPKPKPAAPAKPKAPTPVKKECPAKPKPAAPVKKETPTKVTPVVKKELPPVDEEDTFLKEIGESIQALKTTPQKPSRATLSLPATIQRKVQLTQEEVNLEPTYSEFLIAYLQNALDLPEFGEVKAKIEIDRFGKLIELEILDAKSAKNAEFLKAELPQLDFPAGIADSNQTFTITFRNL
jgi:hypothetical protein